MAEHHQTPNYWAVWIWLAVLTVLEVGVTLIPELATFLKAILLVALAVGKALLVALYFMHLRFETRTLGAIVLTPFVICVFLVFMLMPDVGSELRESPIRAEHVDSSH
jgi:cytochrome c oxidase subunit 4